MPVSKHAGRLLALLIAALPGTGAAADSAALAARVDRLEAADPAPAEWSVLLDELRAAGELGLQARAHRLRCMRLLADPDAAQAQLAAGLAAAGDDFAGERAGLLLCRGYLAELAGESAAAFADYDAAVALARDGGEASVQAQALALRGEQRHLRGDYAAALDDLQAAHALAVAEDSASLTSYALNAIANLYADSHVAQYDQALDYYRQLQARHQAAGRSGELATNRFNIASTLERAGRLDEAITEFRATLDAYLALDDAESLAQTRRALAAVLLRRERAAEALATLAPAREWAEREGSAEFNARIALTEGAALRRSGRLQDALARLDLARDHFSAADNPRFLERIEDERAEALAAAARWADAHAARVAQLGHAQRLAVQLREEQTARMRVQFDSARKEEENRALQRENALRAQALAAAERIRSLQRQVIALALLLIALLALAALRAGLRARQMRRLALTDELTGLPNRRSILASLEAARAAHAGAGVLLLDIDHFKSINDRLGHEVGDLVLQRVAATARDALGDAGVLGRLGGEEFLAVLAGDEAALLVAAERIRAAVAAADLAAVDADLRVTVSIGLACCGPADRRREDVVQRADAALYRAKAGGRNRIERAGDLAC